MRALAAVSLAVMASVALGAQDPPPQFRAATQLVVHAVTVRDRQGQPVTGLTARDFILTEDGAPQTLTFVEYEAIDTTPIGPMTGVVSSDTSRPAAPQPAAVEPVTRGAIQGPVPGDARYRGRRLLVFYFDVSALGLFERARAFDGAAAYVRERMAAADMIAVVVWAGRSVEVRLDFTDNRVALDTMLQQLVIEATDTRLGLTSTAGSAGAAFGDDADEFGLFTADRQLQALQNAVTEFGAIPQAKTLIYFGSGLGTAGLGNMAQLRATVNAAVRAGVTLNPLDARGLQAVPPMGDASRPSPGGIGMFSGATAQRLTVEGDRARDLLLALANDTGGRAVLDNNDLGIGVAIAAATVTGYYLLGYYSTNTADDGRYRRVRIALANGRTADLSYRQGYYGQKDYRRFNAFEKERQLAEALAFPDPITDIPMAAVVHYFRIGRAEYFVPISVRMPGRELVPMRPDGSARADIDVIGEIRNEHGTTLRNSRDRVAFTLPPTDASRVATQPIQYETGFSLLPGHYTIKLLARDATTGRIGTYLREFTIPDLTRETQVRTSSMVLTQQRVASRDTLFTVKQRVSVDVANPLVAQGHKLVPSVATTFSRTRPLFVFLEAYQPDAVSMRHIAAFVTLFRDGVKILETEPVGITDGWDPVRHAIPIFLTVPLDGLDPGGYDCQLTVLDPADGRAAFRRTQIEVR